MSKQFQLEQDNISIEIDPAIFDKPDSQLTQQLYEMARRIAQSDRNNQIYRQAKKSKSFQLQTLKRNKNQLESQLQKIQNQISIKKNVENQNTFVKNNRVKFQQINAKCEDISIKEKQMQKNTCQILKQNQKLQKKLAVLQVQYQIMLKENKHKSVMVAKLAKQKEQKIEITKQNQQKIIELETQCQTSKKRAQDLQNELKQQLKNQQQLQQLINQREKQLQTQRRKRQQTSRKHEQNKRALVKMINSAKSLQNQIQQKLKQGKKLQNLHQNLKHKIITMEQQQKKLQEVISNRRSLINNIKIISNRVTKQEEALNKIKASKQQQQVQ